MARRNVIQFSIEVLDKASKKLASISSSFGKFAKRIAVGASAMAVGLFAATKAAIEAADSIGKTAKFAGITAERLQTLRFAAAQSGVATRGLDDSIRRFNRRLGELANSGLGPAQKAMASLNVEVKDSQNRFKGTEQLFDEVVVALQQVGSAAQQSALAAQLFGDDFGPKLVPLLRQGAAGIAELEQKAKDLGFVISNEAIAAAENANDRFNELTTFIRQRMIKAFADNADTIADVAEALTTAAVKAAEFLTNIAGIFNLTEMTKAKRELKEIRQTITALERGHTFRRGSRWFGLSLENLREMEMGMENFITNLRNARAEVRGGGGGGGGDGEGSPFGVDMSLQGFVDSFDTAQQQVDKKLEMLNQAIAEGLIPDEADQVRIREAILSILTDGLDEIPKRFGKKYATVKPFDFLEQAAEQAARNIQSAFSDFFFDPFEDGLKGLLQAFITTIRRMIAEALALQTIKAFDVKSIFSKILGRSAGGPVTAGQPYIVGERGPELMIPSGSGRIQNNSMLRGAESGMQFVTNIDARGADPGLIARLPAFMEERDKRLMLAVQRYIQTGLMPI